MSLDAPAIKNLHLCCEFQSQLLFIVSLLLLNFLTTLYQVACEQALLFGRAKRVSREHTSERHCREGQRKGELATISHKISFVLRSDEGKYHWLKNDVPENKVD